MGRFGYVSDYDPKRHMARIEFPDKEDLVSADAAGDIEVHTKGNITIKADGDMTLTAKGNMKLQASQIDLN